MKDKLINFFETINVKQKQKNIENSININFIKGAFVEILGPIQQTYTVKFIDLKTNDIVYQTDILNNHWAKTSREWYVDWKIEIYSNGTLVHEHTYNVKNKKVYISMTSESIGDTLAWIPYVEEFRKKHECQVVCSTFHNYLFESKYPDIKFVKPGTTVYDLYAMYEIGIYDGDFNKNKNDHKKIPLQQVASDTLGLDFKEIKPLINVRKFDSNKIPGKYVVICTESTSQCKLWNYSNGWQEIVDYLNLKGYKVVVVQKEKSNLKNVIHKVGNKNLEVAISIINDAEFFIGLSSGLSWVAWALNKKVIMISGFTMPWYEFGENCYRLINIHSCKGCWHEHVFDKGNWYWCPMNKNFECSSTITTDDVIFQINNVINNYDLFYTNESQNEKINLTNSSIRFDFKDNKFTVADAVYYEIFKNRIYNYYKCKINKNDVVVDIGANIGIFTRYAISNEAKFIYAFEPEKENCDLFIKNNGLYENVKLFNFAISDKNDIENLYIDLNSGGHSIIEIDKNKTKTGQKIQVECYTLNYLFENNIIPKEIDFMKIDAEGAEIKILDGISDENLVKIKKFSIEWHHFLFNYDDEKLSSILNRFVKLNYKFYVDNLGTDLKTLYFWK